VYLQVLLCLLLAFLLAANQRSERNVAKVRPFGMTRHKVSSRYK